MSALPATIQEQCQTLAKLLVNTHALLAKSDADAIDPDIYETLAVPLCRLAKMIIPGKVPIPLFPCYSDD